MLSFAIRCALHQYRPIIPVFKVLRQYTTLTHLPVLCKSYSITNIYCLYNYNKMSFTTNTTHSPTHPHTRTSIIKPQNTILFICDIQETFRNKMFNWSELITVASGLTRIGKILDMQIIVTEQQPFSATVQEIDLVTHSDKVLLYKKTKFSMITPELQLFLNKNYVHENIILYGLESHVCVLQTCIELIRLKYTVYLVIDGIGSQRQQDHTTAIQRLIQEGVRVTTSESIIYELLGDAKHDKFKPILSVVKELAKFKSGHATAPQT